MFLFFVCILQNIFLIDHHQKPKSKVSDLNKLEFTEIAVAGTKVSFYITSSEPYSFHR